MTFKDWQKRNYIHCVLNNDEKNIEETKIVSGYYQNSRDRYFKCMNISAEDEREWCKIKSIDYFDIEEDVRRIYVDMDGVVARFLLGKTMEEIFSPGYFRNLPPQEKMIDALKELKEKGWDIFILSKSCFDALEEKIDWLGEYMPFIEPDHCIFVPLEGDKEKFIPPNKGLNILIDDYWKNFKNWDGLKIKAVTEINSRNLIYDDENISIDYPLTITGPDVTPASIVSDVELDILTYIVNNPKYIRDEVEQDFVSGLKEWITEKEHEYDEMLDDMAAEDMEIC